MRWWDDESGYEKYANHDGIKRALDGEWLGEYIYWASFLCAMKKHTKFSVSKINIKDDGSSEEGEAACVHKISPQHFNCVKALNLCINICTWEWKWWRGWSCVEI